MPTLRGRIQSNTIKMRILQKNINLNGENTMDITDQERKLRQEMGCERCTLLNMTCHLTCAQYKTHIAPIMAATNSNPTKTNNPAAISYEADYKQAISANKLLRIENMRLRKILRDVRSIVYKEG